MFPGLLVVSDPEARQRLDKYLVCLNRWAARINLTGAAGGDARFHTLVAPVLGAESLLRGRVVDVGSGNGSPGLVLAALRSDLSFLLLEPRAKRWAFLREAAREMGATNVRVARKRSEELRGVHADTVTMRAVGMDPTNLQVLLSPGGCVLVFGGPPIAGAEILDLPSGARLQRRCFT